MRAVVLCLLIGIIPVNDDWTRPATAKYLLMKNTQTETQSTISPAQASRFAKLALKCITKEYPNKPEHVMNHGKDVQSPKALHPAFYGCYDWHSSVHGHWMLIHLLHLFPALPEAQTIRDGLNANLTPENIAVEIAYLKSPNRQSFERTYGWAWLLKLAEELYRWDDPQGKRWSQAVQPLAQAIVERYLNFLPKQTYPIRTGVHPNTAFGISFALDYAKATENEQLQELLAERSLTYFSRDESYPAGWEPGGEDFFSAALLEADLMRRVLKAEEFQSWFSRFLPELGKGKPESLLEPAIVTDRSDPKLVHLDGLNLSRAWCMRNIAMSLPSSDPARIMLARAAKLHADAGLAHVSSGDYSGEHWLASFAVYMLSTPEP